MEVSATTTLSMEAICPSGVGSVRVRMLSDGTVMGQYNQKHRPWLPWAELAPDTSWGMLADWMHGRGYVGII